VKLRSPDALSMSFVALLTAFAAGRALDQRAPSGLQRFARTAWRTIVTACGALGLAAPVLVLGSLVLATAATALTGVASLIF